jgi:hypothetical protein
LVKIVVATLDPSVSPEEVAARLGAHDQCACILELALEAGVGRTDRDRVTPGGVDGLAELCNARERRLLSR